MFGLSKIKHRHADLHECTVGNVHDSWRVLGRGSEGQQVHRAFNLLTQQYITDPIHIDKRRVPLEVGRIVDAAQTTLVVASTR